MAAIVEACPSPDTGRGRGPLAASYCEAMTQMTMGGAGVSEANGVLHNRCHFLIYIIFSRNRFLARKPCVAARKQFTVMLFCSRRTFFGHFSCVAVRVWTSVTFLGGNMTQWSVNSMLNSVFSDLCVDYRLGNDTGVLRSPVKPGMTVLSL